MQGPPHFVCILEKIIQWKDGNGNEKNYVRTLIQYSQPDLCAVKSANNHSKTAVTNGIDLKSQWHEDNNSPVHTYTHIYSETHKH